MHKIINTFQTGNYTDSDGSDIYSQDQDDGLYDQDIQITVHINNKTLSYIHF